MQNYKQAEKEATRLARKQTAYQLLDADDEDDVVATASDPAADARSSKRKHLRKRKDGETLEDDEDAVSQYFIA